ncbi:sugar phosphate isomerase/epimerase [Pullulanibacillus sp. KACC 23026]|uniref:sugar phosphate isomerase/epimerase family protein n=1 Tax=Pullulanibacillus sp. KACC 23026 TaxID=3028315 RepID=UPI0023AEA80B|nr:sugar phosphate isomerase/epimerase family protein [Pullulanibacillus sp. KACC 23026]WEG10948.1 sugar phosphate isomerase/epimerase [Pullulanibacillus sp. KACC 23026]
MSQFVLSAFADEVATELTTQMDILDEHDIKFIEMRGVNGKPLVHYDLDEVKAIKKAMDERGFKLSAIGSPIGKIKITDDFEPHLALFKHTLEIAKIMECRYIRMFSFFMPEGEDPSNYRDEVLHRWSQFVEAEKGSGVILLHENEKGIYGDTPERCLDLIKSLHSDHVKAIFDFANFVQCDVKNYPDGYELLKDYIEYIHVKDARYSDHQVVPAGHGDGDVKEILKDLYRHGFEGFLSLEPHLWNFKGYSDLEPNSPGFHLPEGEAKNFAVAVQAIKNLIREITNR